MASRSASASRHLAFFLAAMLAGCAGGQRDVVPSADLQPAHSGVWMDGDLKGQDLLYVANWSNGLVNVYKYWTHELVGVLTDFTTPAGECVDRSGNVFIADYNAERVVEYAHAGTKAIRTIDDSPNQPYGCAVDRTTGNLAVANYNEGYGGNLAIFVHGKGKPVTYGYEQAFTACAYDDRGDLLGTAQYGYYGYYTDFSYLPKHGTKLLPISLPDGNSESGSGWGYVQSIGWDGTYWTVGSNSQIYRYTIDIKGQHVDTIALDGSGRVGQVWFYRKTPKSSATQAVAVEGGNGGGVGYWKYPAGGESYYSLTKDLDNPSGVAISLKQ
jgi:hypothetical protein